jgi:hypothetical protein
MDKSNTKLSLKEKIGYSLGDTASHFVWESHPEITLHKKECYFNGVLTFPSCTWAIRNKKSKEATD